MSMKMYKLNYEENPVSELYNLHPWMFDNFQVDGSDRMAICSVEELD